MRAVVQRVSRASVSVGLRFLSSIDRGVVVFLGVGQGDTQADADYLLDKILSLRIFEDDSGKMNASVLDICGGVLLISQFTLFGDCRKGRRPSFTEAEAPGPAKALYEYTLTRLRQRVAQSGAGEFQAMMTIDAVNDGPVTVLLDSKKLF